MEIDLAIVGRGVLGQSIAYRAKEKFPDSKITVIGKASGKPIASLAAGAMLSCFGEVTKYTFESEAGQAKFGLCHSALDRWDGYLDELRQRVQPEQPLEIKRGTYVILNSQGGSYDSENYLALLDAVNRYKQPHQGVEEVPGLEPLATHRPLRSLFLPNEGSLDSNAFMAWLESINRSQGVNYLDSDVLELQKRKGQITGLKLENGDKITAGKSVLAAGAFSWPLLRSVTETGSHIPIIAGSGVSAVTRRVIGKPFESIVRTVNRAGSCGLHVIPLGNFEEYIGATNVVFRDPEYQTHFGVCAFLIQVAVDQLHRDLAYSRVSEWRIGNRPVALDTYPVIGPVEGVSNLYMVGGTYRDGFHSSPVIADMVVNDFMGRDNQVPASLNPSRPYQYYKDAETASLEFAKQVIASLYETGIQIPVFNNDRELMEPYQAKAMQLHKELGVDSGLPPDIMHFLIRSSKNMTQDREWVRNYLRANKRYFAK